MHETTEAYQGALIALNARESVEAATPDDTYNANSVYMREHGAASPQKGEIFRAFYNKDGIPVTFPFVGATQAQFFVLEGIRPPKVLMSVQQTKP
ncbi:MAG: hypothetical protein EOP48_13295 [Sphingobacteriales bacterium]|nr:MAG: hypothetical protein EOP48_13295 [Sphingobacteriales bacterium]